MYVPLDNSIYPSSNFKITKMAYSDILLFVYIDDCVVVTVIHSDDVHVSRVLMFQHPNCPLVL